MAELEGVVRDFRAAGKVANHMTLIGLVDSWSGLVEEVERGYEESVYEYANDVTSPAILDRVGAGAHPEAREALLRWLQPWDERYEAATYERRPRSTEALSHLIHTPPPGGTGVSHVAS
jgi:hypothetical protein